MSTRRVSLYSCAFPGCTATALEHFPEDWWAGRGVANGMRCPEHILEPCPECGRLMRPQKYQTKVRTVRRGAGGVCTNCIRSRQRLENISPQQANYVRNLVRSKVGPEDYVWIVEALGIGMD